MMRYKLTKILIMLATIPIIYEFERSLESYILTNTVRFSQEELDDYASMLMTYRLSDI